MMKKSLNMYAKDVKNMINNKILKVSDIQRHLGISKNRAYELVNLKSFPKIQIGHRFYIPQNAYEQWVHDNLKGKIIL